MERLLSCISGVKFTNIRDRICTSEEKESIGEAYGCACQAPYHLIEHFGASSQDVCRTITEAKQKWGIEAVVIDHLTKIHERRKHENRHQELTLVLSRILTCVAKHNIACILVCQLNREVEKRPNPHPKLSDLRETGSVEEDCRLIWLAFRDEYYTGPESEHPNEMELIVAKNNNGRDGRVILFSDLDRMKIECKQKEEWK